jgi:polysaccharide export outer membrane protein
MKHLLLACIAATLLLSSCVPHKRITYFQPGEGNSGTSIVPAAESTIQSNDIIAVNVNSLNAEADKQFNTTSANADANYAPNTYLVGRDGEISIPLVGKIDVQGLTTSAVADAVKARLLPYLKEPSVSVRFVNFRVTVLGEVSKPGVYNVPSERINVLEALGLAGDLTIYGQRNNVTLIRESAGQREFVNIDLTSRDLFASAHYYLKNNDVLYIEPSRGKSSNDDNIYRIVPIILSSLTFLAVMLNAVIP